LVIMTVLYAFVTTRTGAVSVFASSLIDPAVDQSVRSVGGSEPVPTDLLVALRAVRDPRARRGRRHDVVAVLAVAVCAVLAGARSYITIAEWARDLTPTVRARLGLGRRPPCEATIRRVLQAVDAAELDGVVSTWLAARRSVNAPTVQSDQPRRVIAIDGKSARGARHAGGRAVHLLAAFDTGTGGVLAQTVVDGKTNEINAFAPLLDRIDLTGAIVTADALHTQRAHVHYLIGRGAHYLLTVKANQPTLLRQLRALPWSDVPVADVTTDTAHGRRERRTLKMTTLAAGIGFPHATLALQITRRRRPLAGRRGRTETVYAITDLQPEQTSSAELADAARAHWGIENRLHWVRDVSFGEDLSQVRTGHGPAVMATLRNLAISLLRTAGATNIAAACRHLSRHPARVLPMIM
jgi:predicted transposase YbfD/YdcC